MNFMSNNFIWFTGVVEDRADPLYLNRVKVRCFGFHSPDKNKMPTEDLPWAAVIMPTTESGTSGVGRSPHGLVNGSWVVGFFRDGEEAQDPVVFGSIMAQNTTIPDSEKGFNDPDGNYPKEDYQGQSDVNLAARGLSLQQDINRADIRFIESGKDAQAIKDLVQFDEPETTAAPQYPFNKVYESESGHLFEVDDTLDKQRIREHHRSGTFYEVDATGTKVTKIVNDNYHLVVGDDYINVKGNVRVIVEGEANMFVKGDYNVEVDGNKNEYIYGNLNQVVHGERSVTIDKSSTESIGESESISVGSSQSISVGESQSINIASSQSIDVGSSQSMNISGSQNITASITNINNNVKVAGDVNVTGTVDADTEVQVGSIKLTKHKHLGVQSGPGTTGLPTS